MNEHEARTLTNAIQDSVDKLDELIVTAYLERVWKTMGCASWADFHRGYFESHCIKLQSEAHVRAAARQRVAARSFKTPESQRESMLLRHTTK